MTPRNIGNTLKTVGALGFLALAACTQPNPANHQSPAGSSTAPASATSAANAPVGDKEAAAKALIQAASHGQANVDHIFDGPDGMIGAVVMNPNQTKDIIYLSPNAKVLFPGGGFTAEGKNVAEADLISQHVYISPDDLATKAAQTGFVVGKSGPILTAFMDPNCSWCHVLYTKVQPMVDAGKLRVRYVMIAAIKPSSPARAAAILAAKDPAAALKQDEMRFNEAQEEGGIEPLAKADPAAEQKVRDNTALMGSAGKISTPGLLYCDKDSKQVVYALGMPQDFDGFVGKLGTDGHASCSK